MKWWSLRIFEKEFCAYTHRTQTTDWRNIFLSRWSWSVEWKNSWQNLLDNFLGFVYMYKPTTVCTGLYIHSLVARTLFCTWRVHNKIRTSSCVSHTRTAQVWKPNNRQREQKEEVLWSVLQSRCQRWVDRTIFGVIHFRLLENSVLMDEISNNILSEELKKPLVKNQLREFFLSTRWRSRIWSEEIQNTHWVSRDESLTTHRRQFHKVNRWADHAQRERIHLWSRLVMEGPSSWRMLCKKLPRNWRIEKTQLSRRKHRKKISYAPWSGITNSESIPLRSWLTDHLEIKKAKWRTWNAANEKPENTNIPGNVFDCQHARREPGELHNALKIWQYHREFREEKELRKLWAKIHCNQYFYLVCSKVKARQNV